MKQRILVLDDDTFWLQLFIRQLEGDGFIVIQHTDAAEAINDIDSSISAIVVDMMLGYNTVLPLLHEMRSDVEIANIPIIVCSNIASTITEKSMLSYGVLQIIDKTTMKPGDLSAAIKRVTV